MVLIGAVRHGPTVKTQVDNLFSKAALRDRAQAVTYAYRQGLVRWSRSDPCKLGLGVTTTS
jgi:hypothetical protein